MIERNELINAVAELCDSFEKNETKSHAMKLLEKEFKTNWFNMHLKDWRYPKITDDNLEILPLQEWAKRLTRDSFYPHPILDEMPLSEIINLFADEFVGVYNKLLEKEKEIIKQAKNKIEEEKKEEEIKNEQ